MVRNCINPASNVPKGLKRPKRTPCTPEFCKRIVHAIEVYILQQIYAVFMLIFLSEKLSTGLTSTE